MEKSFEMWIQKHGLSYGLHGYLTEVHIYNKHTKKYGFLDFVFPRKHLVIELDGKQHLDLDRKRLDQIRDENLEARGWRVLRISHKEYIKKSRVDEISRLLFN